MMSVTLSFTCWMNLRSLSHTGPIIIYSLRMENVGSSSCVGLVTDKLEARISLQQGELN